MTVAKVMLSGPTMPDVGSLLPRYLWIFVAALVVSLVLTPVMRAIARRLGIVDKPDGSRKCHKAPVAYLGGLAMFLGWTAALGVGWLVIRNGAAWSARELWMASCITVGPLVIVFVGLRDDIRSLRPRTKILGEVTGAAVLLLGGIGTHVTQPILLPAAVVFQQLTGWPAGNDPWLPEWLVVVSSCAFVLCVVVGCCNATNLMDGLDGLCGGVTAIIAAGFLFLVVYLAIDGDGSLTGWDHARLVLAMALLGAVLGFLPYNFNPASIFMGDAGSLFLGFNCATLIILMGQDKHPQWILCAMVIFALPSLDTAMAFVRRWLKGRAFFSPDRFHFHHQLINRGLSVRQAVAVSYGLALVFAVLGCAVVFLRLRYIAAVWIVTFAGVVFAAYRMGMIHERTPAPAPAPRPPEPVSPRQPEELQPEPDGDLAPVATR